MPIHKMNHSDGIFFAKPVGYFDSIDGKMWSNAFKNYAKNSYLSIGAIMDMTEVDRVCPTLMKVFGEIVKLDPLVATALIIDPNMYSRNSRVIDKIATYRNVQVFHSRIEAENYVNTRLTVGSATVSTYSFSTPAFGTF